MRTYPVRLLDGVVELPASVVVLARLCGTPLIPFSVLPVAPRRWRVEIEEPLDPPARDAGPRGRRRVLQALADRWTATLRAHAEHWAAVYPMTWQEASNEATLRSRREVTLGLAFTGSTSSWSVCCVSRRTGVGARGRNAERIVELEASASDWRSSPQSSVLCSGIPASSTGSMSAMRSST